MDLDAHVEFSGEQDGVLPMAGMGRSVGLPLCAVWDDGLQAAAWHVQRDQRLLEQATRGPHLRFARYPVSVLLGAYEQTALAVRHDYCLEQGVQLQRRLTGGGAVYLDPSQLCWSLVIPVQDVPGAGLASVLERHGQAVVHALATLGATAEFVAPNDIEYRQRKLGSSFAVYHQDHWLIQGSVLLVLPEVEAMLKALRVPTEKLSHEGVLSARQRLVSLAALLGGDESISPDRREVQQALTDAFAEAFGFTMQRHAPEAFAVAPVPALDEDTLPLINDTGFKAFSRTEGGTLYVALQVDAEQCVRQVQLSGTVQFTPADLFARLQTGLQGCPLGAVLERLEALLSAVPDFEGLGFSAADLLHVFGLAVARQQQAQAFAMDQSQANTLIIHNPQGESATDILSKATVMLVPYCAKLAKCKFRHRDDCTECGECTVSDAYRLARERGMEVVTITRFEHLQETLARMQAEGVPAYVGMCCESFYLKRHYAFQAAGIPAVLTDITGANCYELHEEDLAYAGKFRAEAHLDLDVVAKVMHFVPNVKTSSG